MGDNKPKRQHHVPEVIIKNFVNQDRRVWVGDRESGRVFCTGLDNVFVESDQYTRYGFGSDADRRDYGYEMAFSDLESAVGPVVVEIVSSARIGRVPRLSEQQTSTLKRFVLLQARRTRESRQRVSSQRDPDEVFYEAAASVLTAGGYDPPPQDVLLAEEGMREFARRIAHNVDARFSAGDHPDLVEEEASFCRETGLCVAVIGVPRRSFILGSHGITIREKTEGDVYLLGGLLPVANDVIVQVTPLAGQVTLLRLDDGSEPLIGKINRATASRSRWIAGQSERLIRSLV